MKFIKLTDFTYNQKVFVNMDLIDAILWETDDGAPHTLLYRTGLKTSWYSVKQTPEEILEMLK